MGELADEVRPRPFHERFNIEVDFDSAKGRFINRATNNVFDSLREDLPPEDYWTLKRAVASSFGIRYDNNKAIEYYVAGDFTRCLQALEAIYETFSGYRYQEQVSNEIYGLLQKERS